MSTAIKKRSPFRTFFIVCVVLLALGATAGAAVWWWNNRPIQPVSLSSNEQQALEQKIEEAQARPGDPKYEPGGKTIVLTERELNGLLNQNTSWGEDMKIELATDAIHARVRTELDEDFPFLGGQTLKAKARFFVKTEAENPAIILDDLTVWGVSVPNAWLAELKGKNLLATVGGDIGDNLIARGIEDISIKNGELAIQLAE